MLHFFVISRLPVTVEGYVVAEFALDEVIDLFLARREAISHLLNGLTKRAMYMALSLLSDTWSELTVHGEHGMSFKRQVVFLPELLVSNHHHIMLSGP